MEELARGQGVLRPPRTERWARSHRPQNLVKETGNKQPRKHVRVGRFPFSLPQTQQPLQMKTIERSEGGKSHWGWGRLPSTHTLGCR